MRVAKNSLWLLLARIGTQGMAALFTIILARRLGSIGFGEYAVVAAIVFVGNMLTTFGTDMSIIREIAARDNFSWIPVALLIQLALSLLFILLLWFGSPFLLPRQSMDGFFALRIYSLALIPLSFFTIFTSVLRGKQFMGAYTWLNLIGAFLQLVMVWIFIYPGASVVSLAWLLLLSQMIVSCIGGMICKQLVNGFWQNWRFSTKNISILVKASTPLAVLSAIAMLYQKAGILIISTVGGSAMAGFFSIAQRMVEAAKTVHIAVFTALYPAMVQSKDETFRLSWIFLLAGAGIGAISLSASAGPLAEILFGADYEASISALQTLSWILLPYTVSSFLVLKFVASNQETPVLRASLTSLVLLISLGLWWIPRAGLTGAGSSALVAESTQAALLFWQWRVK
jgi:O-antigen/teichoic acid export membrane protein